MVCSGCIVPDSIYAVAAPVRAPFSAGVLNDEAWNHGQLIDTFYVG